MRSASSNRAQPRAHILLVDDNQDGLVARRSVLEELGHDVISARCGSDALRAVAEKNPDLIITAYSMSPTNSLELIAELRQQNFTKPIILLSGLAETLGFTPKNTGADAVIQKSANEVAHLIRHTQRLLSAPKKAAGTSRRSSRNLRSKTAANDY